jgi:hypothetical protein
MGSALDVMLVHYIDGNLVNRCTIRCSLISLLLASDTLPQRHCSCACVWSTRRSSRLSLFAEPFVEPFVVPLVLRVSRGSFPNCGSVTSTSFVYGSSPTASSTALRTKAPKKRFRNPRDLRWGGPKTGGCIAGDDAVEGGEDRRATSDVPRASNNVVRAGGKAP